MRNKKVIDMIFVLLLTVLFFVCAEKLLSNHKILEQSLDYVQVRLAQPVDSAMAYQMASQEQLKVSGKEYVLWERELLQTITSPDLEHRSVYTEVVAICGKSALLFDGCVVLDYADQNNCLLSEKTACELFGTTDVIGLTIQYQGKTYTILDLVPIEEHLMVYQIEKDDTVSLSMVTIDNREHKSAAYTMEQFGVIWGLSYLIDYQWMVFLAKTLTFWVQILILVFIMLQLKQYLKNNTTRATWLSLLSGFVIIIAVVILLINSIYLPAEYLADIANRDFWNAFIVEKVQAMKSFFSVEKGIWEIKIIHAWAKILLLIICELLIFGFLKKFVIRRDIHGRNQ